VSTSTTYASNRAQYKILLLLDALQYEPLSVAELADELPMCRASIKMYLAHVGAHVAQYLRTPYNYVPRYSMSGKRAYKPKAMSNAERKRLEWQKIRNDPALHEARKEYRRKTKTGILSITSKWVK